jgi:hypothetical protein
MMKKEKFASINIKVTRKNQWLCANIQDEHCSIKFCSEYANCFWTLLREEVYQCLNKEEEKSKAGER